MKLPVFITLMLLFVTISSALEIDTVFQSDIYVRELEAPILFTVEFRNVTPGDYHLYTYANFDIEPAGAFYLDNDTTKNFTVIPYNVLESGRNVFSYSISRLNSEEKMDKRMVINFLNFKDMIEIETNNIDFDSGVVKIYVKNLEDYSFKNLTATFSSILFNINETFNLDAKETKIINVNVNEELLKVTKAGTYVLDGMFKVKNKTVQIQGKLYLGAKSDVKTSENKMGFLNRKLNITKVNEGNTIELINIKVTKNIFTRMFTKFSTEPVTTYREKGKIHYSWDFKLSPNESYTVISSTNYYYPILLVGFTVAIVYFIIQYLRIKVEVKKKANPIKTKNGEFALRVNVTVKAKIDMYDVSLIDRIPTTVKLYKNSPSITPDKIDVETRKIKWKIGDLKAGEERLYSYIVYSRVGYVGRFSLPRAVVRYKIGEEDIVLKETSKEIFFLSEQNDNIKKQ